MADLKTDYVDDILNTAVNTNRKYQMIDNGDGTVSFVDVTDYTQQGDGYGATQINEQNEAINELKSDLTEQVLASVVGNGVKTYATLLSELASALDYTKLTKNSFLRYTGTSGYKQIVPINGYNTSNNAYFSNTAYSGSNTIKMQSYQVGTSVQLYIQNTFANGVLSYSDNSNTVVDNGVTIEIIR